MHSSWKYGTWLAAGALSAWALSCTSADPAPDPATGAGGNKNAGTSGAGGTGGLDNTAGASGHGGGGGATPSDRIGKDTRATVFDGEHIWFGAEDHRNADRTVELPDGLHSKIMLHWKLRCPPRGCDPWDRIASLYVVRKNEQDPTGDGSEELLEIARLITPYGVGYEWSFDVTRLAPLLHGTQKFRLFIDTWVDGWINDISIDYTGGVPERIPVAVENLWEVSSAIYGDPAQPIEDRFPDRAIAGPGRGSGSAPTVRVLLTGHGQGNENNCAEFCERTHTLAVSESRFELALKNLDCSRTPVPGQQGSWRYPRAGWCPGAAVEPFELEIEHALAPSGPTSFALLWQSYENQCRPANAGSDLCRTKCTIGTDCNYNYNGHAEPYYKTSALLVWYR